MCLRRRLMEGICPRPHVCHGPCPDNTAVWSDPADEAWDALLAEARRVDLQESTSEQRQ
jgi:hypothetical protein